MLLLVPLLSLFVSGIIGVVVLVDVCDYRLKPHEMRIRALAVLTWPVWGMVILPVCSVLYPLFLVHYLLQCSFGDPNAKSLVAKFHGLFDRFDVWMENREKRTGKKKRDRHDKVTKDEESVILKEAEIEVEEFLRN